VRAAFEHRYPDQRVHFGSGAAGNLTPLLERHGVERPLLVCGRSAGRDGTLLDTIADGAGGRVAAVFDGVVPHVPVEVVDAAVERYRELGCDALISVGGGSAHDAARGVSLCLQTGRRMAEHFPDPQTPFYWHEQPRSADAPAIIAIPATLSAAEATFGGGVTSRGRKLVFVGDALFVQHIVLDPAVAARAPKELVLSTGMNAVNHAVERLAAANRQPLADAAFVHALRLLMPALEAVHAAAEADLEALADCLLGAHLSISTNVRGGIGHAIPHVLGGRYGIGHGVANGVAMPYAAAYAGRRDRAALELVRAELVAQGRLATRAREPGDVAAALATFVSGLGLPSRLRDLGVPHGDVPAIATEVLEDFSAARLGLSRAEVEELLESAW
jgi:alcohol dehydrogenase class IV